MTLDSLITIILLSAILLVMVLFLFKNKNQKEKITSNNTLNTEVAEILLKDNILEKINTIIDSLVQQYTDVYNIMVISNTTQIEYINAKEQENMEKYVTHMVLTSISPDLKNLMGLVYNVQTAEDLKNVVSLRVKMFLINYLVQYNNDIEE